jgi:hypothetical protein
VLGCRRPHGDALLPGCGQGGLDRGDFTQPALLLSFPHPVEEARVDPLQPRHLSRVDLE